MQKDVSDSESDYDSENENHKKLSEPERKRRSVKTKLKRLQSMVNVNEDYITEIYDLINAPKKPKQVDPELEEEIEFKRIRAKQELINIINDEKTYTDEELDAMFVDFKELEKIDKEIVTKIRRLLQTINSLKAENVDLKKACENLTEEVESFRSRESLKNEIKQESNDIGKMSASEQEVEEIKEKIEELAQDKDSLRKIYNLFKDPLLLRKIMSANGANGDKGIGLMKKKFQNDKILNKGKGLDVSQTRKQNIKSNKGSNNQAQVNKINKKMLEKTKGKEETKLNSENEHKKDKNEPEPVQGTDNSQTAHTLPEINDQSTKSNKEGESKKASEMDIGNNYDDDFEDDDGIELEYSENNNAKNDTENKKEKSENISVPYRNRYKQYNNDDLVNSKQLSSCNVCVDKDSAITSYREQINQLMGVSIEDIHILRNYTADKQNTDEPSKICVIS